MRSALSEAPAPQNDGCSSADPTTLVRRTRAGDRQAFDALVHSYQNAALATAYTYVARSEDAFDIVQDAFIEAYCKLAQLKDPERFGGWLRQIVRCRALDWTRRRQTVNFISDASSAAHAALAKASAEVQTQQQASAELWEAVEALPMGQREVVLLYYQNRQPYREIGRQLGLSVSTVNARLKEARIALRKKLSEGDERFMASIKLENQVKDSICQIATEEIQQSIPLEGTDHIVLFCGIDADLELCHTDGDAVVITGSKSTIGLSAEEAATSLQDIQVLKNIHGTVQVDLAYNDLDASDLHGDIAIRNRYGTTRFSLHTYQDNSRYHLEADSGTIHLNVKEPLNQKLHFVMHTICGHMDASGLKSADRTSLNPLLKSNLLSMTTRNDPGEPAAVYINTRAGNIKIERTPA